MKIILDYSCGPCINFLWQIERLLRQIVIKLMAGNNRNLFSYCYGGQKSKIGILGHHQGVGRVLFSLMALRENLFFAFSNFGSWWQSLISGLHKYKYAFWGRTFISNYWGMGSNWIKYSNFLTSSKWTYFIFFVGASSVYMDGLHLITSNIFVYSFKLKKSPKEGSILWDLLGFQRPH